MAEAKEESEKTILKAPPPYWDSIVFGSCFLSIVIGVLLMVCHSHYFVPVFGLAICLGGWLTISDEYGYNIREWEVDWTHGFIQVDSGMIIILPSSSRMIWMGEIAVDSIHMHNYRVWFKSVNKGKWYSIRCAALPCDFLEKFQQAVKKAIHLAMSQESSQEKPPFTTYLKSLLTENKKLRKLSQWKKMPNEEVYYCHDLTYLRKVTWNVSEKRWQVNVVTISDIAWKNFAKEHQLISCKTLDTF